MFTVFNNQEKMETDGDGIDEEMVLHDKTSICQFEEARVDSTDVEFSLTVNEFGPLVYLRNYPIFQQRNWSKTDQSRKKHREVFHLNDDFSEQMI